MTPEAMAHLLQTAGATGAVLIAALFALRHLHNQLSAVQEKRIADAQLATTKLLELVESQHEHQVLLARAIESNADAVRELRMLIEAATAERGMHKALPNMRVGRP